MAQRGYGGAEPSLGARVYIDPCALVIGRATLGDDVSVWPYAVIRADVNRIEIGERTNIQDGSVLHVVRAVPGLPDGLPLLIGADVTVGHKAMLHAARIGDRCLIGMSAVILDGAVVENEVVVAAGSVVPPRKRLLARGLYVGNPAKRMRELSDGEIDQIREGTRHYVKLKDEYRGSAQDERRGG